ncbi:MAG: prolyl oligopeptidase family serine peptidase [Tannerellaceae bacterium]|jgi:dipeptidyl aminopeptidase/acylaminoacyl peptidase|nr:prolyl oligopeptidase family serine peptidase [Tannerellaceae bacterium]
MILEEMKTPLALLTALLLITASPLPAQETSYMTPPKEIADIALAKLPPTVIISNDNKWMLIMGNEPFLSVADLAEPEYKLAGTRVNALFGPSRQAGYSSAILKNIATKEEHPLAGLPDNAGILEAGWSPGSTCLALILKEEGGYYLWTVSLTDMAAVRRSNRRLNMTASSPATPQLTLSRWIDEETIVLTAVPSGTGDLPMRTHTPSGPVVRVSEGKAAPVRTYQDLLKNPYDERLFDYLFTSQPVCFSPQGEREIGKPGIYSRLSLSPDRHSLLTITIERPYSYAVTMRSFPETVTVLSTDGKTTKEINRRPLLPDGIGYDATSPFPRNYDWRPDKPSTLYWVEAQDEGDPRLHKAPFMDIVYQSDYPFDGGKRQLARTTLRFRAIQWGSDDFALISEASQRTRRIKTYVFAPNKPDKAPELIFDLSSDDSYADMGSPLLVYNSFHRKTLFTDKAHNELLFVSNGASPEGDMPYLSRYNIKTGRNVILWRCKAPYYERIVSVTDPVRPEVITSRESVDEPVNYFLSDIKAKKSEALTAFANPYPQLKGMKVEKMRYKRADGLSLTATLYTPPGYDSARDGRLPVFMWAYPREYRDAGDAAQVRGSKYMFTTISYRSPVYWVARGFAVMDNVEMPIVGQDGTEPNDNFIEQLTTNAQAAALAIHSAGVGDTSRMAVGGHSYGGFMTTNLLTHTTLYKAGIARSGAYNRTLTPFGFQAETRSYWEAPDVYRAMSPFNYADKLSGALLLVHGEEDNNTGTFPIQSERMFAAIQGNGGISRFILLPYESHAYSAKENILHLLYETDAWLERYVKDAGRTN